MTFGRRTAAVVATIAALGTLVAGAVAGSSRSTDAVALQRTRGPADKGIEQKVDDLVKQMTLQEKLMQLQLDADWQATDDQARAGLGGVFSLTDPAKIDHLQHVAVEQSRLHIPILFAFDTIHGYRTVFPVPLGEASSFDPSVVTADDTIAARETATVGIKQIYSPMVDVSHEPRWGRIAEGAGEDPYLGSVFAAARVKAAQGNDYSAARQGRDEPEALRGVRPARGRARVQHDRHVGAAAAQHLPAAVQGRDRRRRRHGDVLVQRDQRRARLREPRDGDGHPQARVALRRLRRERLHRRRRADPPRQSRATARTRARRR